MITDGSYPPQQGVRTLFLRNVLGLKISAQSGRREPCKMGWKAYVGGTWQPVEPTEAFQLNSLRKRGARKGVVSAGGTEHFIDFLVMTATNKETGKMRMIVYEDDLSGIESTDALQALDPSVAIAVFSTQEGVRGREETACCSASISSFVAR